MNGRTVQEVILKWYAPENKNFFLNELYFYQTFSGFTPKLIDYDLNKQTLIVEKLTPLIHIPDNHTYKDKLRKLLEDLHNAGANHRDVTVNNVVVTEEDEVLLIDWENATTERGAVSADLYGAEKAGVEPQEPDVWWGYDWEFCPGKYWGEL